MNVLLYKNFTYSTIAYPSPGGKSYTAYKDYGLLRLFKINSTYEKSANGFLIKNDIAAVLSSPLHCSRSGLESQNALYSIVFNNVVFNWFMYLLICVDVKIVCLVKKPTPN